jgi:glycosyltransferase involved in cell wall biosynthesis
MLNKLIIQIPCYNEEETLSIVLNELPRKVPGFKKVEWLVIDDGSQDSTSEVAKANGVDHVVRHKRNQGLAKAFMTGLHACLERGADVIVNTDADNQYSSKYIPDLIQPILDGNAEMVIGTRPISQIQHFSPVKKVLQKLGSWVVRVVSKTEVEDAPSGFRAITRELAMRLNVFNDYTYTLETIIQAGQNRLAVASVPVEVNEDLRPSRLVKSITSYINRSIMTMIRIFVIYQPFKFFSAIGSVFFAMGSLLGVRYLYYMIFFGSGSGHVQSLILTAILIIVGFNTFLIAFIADILAANRKLSEDSRYRMLKFALDKK